MLRGRTTHRRTQSDYRGALLDRATLETWGDVIDATVAKAKDGDAQARAFLAAYLVGKPAHDAPEPLAVTAARIGGNDPLVHKLSSGLTHRRMDDDEKELIREAVATELPAHIEPQPRAIRAAGDPLRSAIGGRAFLTLPRSLTHARPQRVGGGVSGRQMLSALWVRPLSRGNPGRRASGSEFFRLARFTRA
ncbi:MAG: hypothetical protein EPN38_06555 [Rhodanobacteraceae bacterium]|nr:MAG: hypothetical protein EPN38_06555 [Rhodanobacteraceae bacterium]